MELQHVWLVGLQHSKYQIFLADIFHILELLPNDVHLALTMLHLVSSGQMGELLQQRSQEVNHLKDF